MFKFRIQTTSTLLILSSFLFISVYSQSALENITTIKHGVKSNEKYAHAYFGYARTPDDIGWLGRTHCYRFHIDDPIHFDESLRFTICRTRI